MNSYTFSLPAHKISLNMPAWVLTGITDWLHER